MMDRRAEHALQMILDACSVQRYVPPYDVSVSDARGTQIAARFDQEGGTPLEGDLGSVGMFSPPLKVFVTDARGECAEFLVGLFDTEDGQRLPPVITYPADWIKAKPAGPDEPTIQ